MATTSKLTVSLEPEILEALKQKAMEERISPEDLAARWLTMFAEGQVMTREEAKRELKGWIRAHRNPGTK